MDRGKKRRWLHVPSPAMIVACVALFVAMGGTSYAAVTLAANSVGTKQIKKYAVTSAKIKSAAVTAAKVKDGTLTGAKIKDATLTGAKLADGAVTAAKLADAAVTEAKLADGAVAPAKMGTIPGARVTSTAALTLTSGASSWVTFDTTDFNVGAVYNAAQPTRMTAPIAGRYLIMATVRWSPNNVGRRILALELNHSVATIARNSVSPYSTTGTFAPEQTVQVVYKLNAGDYVEVFANQDSGGDLGLQVSAAANVLPTFTMQWIAP
jgi:hypothetical protein